MDKPTKDLLKKAMDFLESARNIIASVGEAARETFDEMSEKAREGDKGQKLDEFADELKSMDNGLDDTANQLGDLIDNN